MRVTNRASRVPIHGALVALLVAMILAACGGSAAGPLLSDVGGPVDGASGRDAEQPAAGEGQGAAATAGPGDPGDGLGARDDARIIRTGSMELEVDNVQAAVRVARDVIRGLGGYIGASQTYNQNDEPYAEITYRIPVDRWEDALDALRSLTGISTKVIAERTEAVDVTGQVADLAARIRNLKSSETALLAIAEQATRISDILDVQARLTEVRGQIEQLEAQQLSLADRTTYATLAVTYQVPAVAAIEIAAKGWDPVAIFDEASASLVGMLQALAGAGIWFVIVWVPGILVLALVVASVIWLLRRSGMLERATRPAPPLASD